MCHDRQKQHTALFVQSEKNQKQLIELQKDGMKSRSMQDKESLDGPTKTLLMTDQVEQQNMQKDENEKAPNDTKENKRRALKEMESMFAGKADEQPKLRKKRFDPEDDSG